MSSRIRRGSLFAHDFPSRVGRTRAVQARNQPRRCCMKTLRGCGGLARISRDPPQEPHYRDAVEGPSHV